jgi:hypothetical protein
MWLVVSEGRGAPLDARWRWFGVGSAAELATHPSDGTQQGLTTAGQPQLGHTAGVLGPPMAHSWGPPRPANPTESGPARRSPGLG